MKVSISEHAVCIRPLLRYKGHGCQILRVPLPGLPWAQHGPSAVPKSPEIVEVEILKIVYSSVKFEVTPATAWLRVESVTPTLFVKVGMQM